MKIVNLQERREQIDSEVMDGIAKELDAVKEAAKEGRLHQFVLQYDIDTVGEDTEEAPQARCVVFWNKNENMDEIVGFCERLMFRMNVIAESSGE